LWWSQNLINVEGFSIIYDRGCVARYEKHSTILEDTGRLPRYDMTYGKLIMVAKDTHLISPACVWKLPTPGLLQHWKSVYSGAINDHTIRVILRDRVLFPFNEGWVIPEIEAHHSQRCSTY